MNAPLASPCLAMAGPAPDGALGTVNLLILALGGEGGGVLADWLVATAQAAGLPVQATSVPGVAQRTGATSYYIELLRAPLAGDGQPVFCLSPTPGDIDLLVSSELLETGRALERGLTDPQRTTLLSSTARFLTVAEKMQMGDGRLDPARILQAGQALCRDAVFFDMAAETRAAGTVISSVMFGAIAASGVLPLDRQACEATIRAGGLAVDASLAGFARGFDAVMRGRTDAAGARAGAAAAPGMAAAAPGTAAAAPGTAPPAPGMSEAAPASSRSAPGPLAETLRLGRAKLRDFQDAAYESLYEQRIGALGELERRVHGSETVTAQAARWLALWMAYEDLIRVADLKSRPQRLERIRREMGAQAHEPVVVREFFKPGVDEVAAILPPPLARRVLAWGQRRGITALSAGIRLQTTSAHGWLALRLLASLRRFRPRSSRFLQEQAAIDGWLAALAAALAAGGPDAHRLALEIAQCPRLLKGYGETWTRGRQNFETLMRTLAADGSAAEPPGARADRLRTAREAALRDPEGRQLAGALGLPPPAPKVYPIRIVKRSR